MLLFDEKPLFAFEDGYVQLYRDDYSEGPKYPLSKTRSGLELVADHPDYTRLCAFRDQVSRFVTLFLETHLLLFADDAERTLFLDEPDNYITLPELQPWLAELEDGCGDMLPQAILISHHPEAIDFLSDKAVWLGREPESHTRILDVKNDTMLKTSQLCSGASTMTQASESLSIATKDSVIHSRKDTMSGTPVFKGTRVVVKNLFDYLASGYSLDVFLEDFPSVSREQAVRALEMAKEALESYAYESAS